MIADLDNIASSALHCALLMCASSTFHILSLANLCVPQSQYTSVVQ